VTVDEVVLVVTGHAATDRILAETEVPEIEMPEIEGIPFEVKRRGVSHGAARLAQLVSVEIALVRSLVATGTEALKPMGHCTGARRRGMGALKDVNFEATTERSPSKRHAGRSRAHRYCRRLVECFHAKEFEFLERSGRVIRPR
jgi:hypothetical protein